MKIKLLKRAASVILGFAVAATALAGCTNDKTDSEGRSKDAVAVNLSNADKISAKGVSSKNGVVTFQSGGTYYLSSSLENGQLVVNAPKQSVTLILNSVSVKNKNGNAIYIYKAKDVTLTLNGESIVTDGESYSFDSSITSKDDDEPNACVYSKSDLVINGNGKLTVSGNYSNGITSKDTLKIENCKLNVTANNHGICGKDSCTVKKAEITVKSGGDGLRSTNNSEESWDLLKLMKAP